MKVRQVLTTTILPLLLTGVAHAASTTYNSTTGSWSDGTKWTSGVPGSGAGGQPADAIINIAGSTVTYQSSTNPTLNSVTLDATGAGATLSQGADTLTTGTLTIGNTAIGTYTQTGGSLVVTGDTATSHLIIGAGAGGVGTFNLSGTGSVTAKAIHVGGGTTTPAGAARGSFVQSGGTVTVTTGSGTVIVGDTSGTSGNYTISGGALTANQLYIALQGANPTVGDRSFVQTGGTVTINDNLVLGGYDQGPSTPAGTYTLNGANAVLNTSKVWVGLSGSGTFTQETGTHNINLGTAVGDHSLLIAAAQPGSTGVYNMKGGTLNADGVYVGYFDGASATGGSGTLNHTGGTINVGQQMIVDNGNTASSLGTYTISGSAVLNTTTASADPGLYVAGKFQQQGGTVNANSTGTGAGLRIDGTYQNSGGTLQGSGTKINYGTYSGFGTVAGGKFVNEGAATFSGGVNTINAPVENGVGRSLEIGDNVATFNAAVSNSGEFKTSGATAVFNGAFTNLSGSYLNAITAGDLFRIGGSLSMQGGDASLWSTETAVLEFFKGTGNTDGNHSLLYAGLDLGGTKNATGFLGYQDNFSWGEIIIRAGNQLVTSGGGALYTEKLTFDTADLAQIQAQIATFTGNLKIYYDPADNPQLQGRKFDFGSGGGSVAPVPEPSTLLILGVGAIGLGVRRRRHA